MLFRTTTVQPDRRLAEEFRRNPIGHHSPDLQRLLNVFRGEDPAGKYILVSIKPHREWMLAQLPDVPGDPIRLHSDYVFDDLAEAEWEVFVRRWKKYFGEDISDLASDDGAATDAG